MDVESIAEVMQMTLHGFLRRLPFLVLALAAVTALAACGEDSSDRVEPTSTTTQTDAGAATPERWVGIDEDGRLVTVRSATGEVERVLGEFDHPEDCPEAGEPEAGCRWVTGVALGPDGRDVYYETCCEPAPGAIHRVPISGGQPELVHQGAFPAVDPAGERLAAVELQWVVVRHLQDDRVERFQAAGPTAALHGMAWSPDGRRLAFSLFERTDRPGRLHLLDVGEARSLDDARPLGPADPDRSWTLPAFREDGTVAVAEQELRPPGEPRGPARILFVDPGSGAVEDEFDPGDRVLSQRYDASGRYLLYVTGDGSVTWRGGDRSQGVLSDGGYLAAAW